MISSNAENHIDNKCNIGESVDAPPRQPYSTPSSPQQPPHDWSMEQLSSKQRQIPDIYTRDYPWTHVKPSIPPQPPPMQQPPTPRVAHEESQDSTPRSATDSTVPTSTGLPLTRGHGNPYILPSTLPTTSTQAAPVQPPSDASPTPHPPGQQPATSATVLQNSTDHHQCSSRPLQEWRMKSLVTQRGNQRP